MKEFLLKAGHPVVERWKEKEAAPPTAEEAKEAVKVPELEIPMEMAGAPVGIAGGGFKIILKNATITAEKLIIKKIERK